MVSILKRRFYVMMLRSIGLPPLDQIKVVLVKTDSTIVGDLPIGAPQGSTFGSSSFVAYTEYVTDVFEQHRVCHRRRTRYHHAIQVVQRPSHRRWVRSFVASVNNWSAPKCNQLNKTRAEVMWFGDQDILKRPDIRSAPSYVYNRDASCHCTEVFGCVP
jgi:hypothetical protein